MENAMGNIERFVNNQSCYFIEKAAPAAFSLFYRACSDFLIRLGCLKIDIFICGIKQCEDKIYASEGMENFIKVVEREGDITLICVQ